MRIDDENKNKRKVRNRGKKSERDFCCVVCAFLLYARKIAIIADDKIKSKVKIAHNITTVFSCDKVSQSLIIYKYELAMCMLLASNE